MKVELRKVSINRGLSEETTAFSAEIWIDGVFAGYAKNAGHGGCNDVTILDRKLREKFFAHIKTLPQVKILDDWQPQDEDGFIADLLDRHRQKKTCERQAKTKILAVAADDPRGSYVCFNASYSPEAAARIKAKHPEILCFYNENPEQFLDIILRPEEEPPAAAVTKPKKKAKAGF